MIENSERIQSMLNNIIDKAMIIKNDFNRNGKTHCNYVLEKLSGAEWDLKVLINLAEAKKIEEE